MLGLFQNSLLIAVYRFSVIPAWQYVTNPIINYTYYMCHFLYYVVHSIEVLWLQDIPQMSTLLPAQFMLGGLVARQVWGLKIFKKVKTSLFLLKHTISVSVDCSWHCPWTLAAIMAHLAMSLSFLCVSREATREASLMALEGQRVSSKSPSMVQDWDKGVASA